MSLRLLAYAKLNVWLRILDRRDDGYHALDSLVHTVDLADVLTLERSEGPTRLSCDVDIDGENLVQRAIRETLRRLDGDGQGIRAHLSKKIPMGAGLGGGSSDAAAAIWGVNHLFGSPLRLEEMTSIAAAIGSDVALFLHGGCVRMQGRGEIAQPMEFQDVRYVILAPPTHCETHAVYGSYDTKGQLPTDDRGIPEPGDNDLEVAALAIYPELERYARSIRRCGGIYAGMTGSGSGFFVATDTGTMQARAAETLRARHPESQVYTCQSTGRGFAEVERTE